MMRFAYRLMPKRLQRRFTAMWIARSWEAFHTIGPIEYHQPPGAERTGPRSIP
jgi:hypothetical protein